MVSHHKPKPRFNVICHFRYFLNQLWIICLQTTALNSPPILSMTMFARPFGTWELTALIRVAYVVNRKLQDWFNSLLLTLRTYAIDFEKIFHSGESRNPVLPCGKDKISSYRSLHTAESFLFFWIPTCVGMAFSSIQTRKSYILKNSLRKIYVLLTNT